MARNNPTFYIVATSNYTGDNGEIIMGNIPSRKTAETQMKEMSSSNTGDIKHDRNYQVMSQTQVNRRFGRDNWYNCMSDKYIAYQG